MMNIYQVFCRN